MNTLAWVTLAVLILICIGPVRWLANWLQRKGREMERGPK
jgi:hypothetical protein